MIQCGRGRMIYYPELPSLYDLWSEIDKGERFDIIIESIDKESED